MSPQSQQEFVRFSATGASIAGAISGVVMAIGVPWVVLAHGAALGPGTQTALVWVGVIAGALIALTSAFFGLVMPSQVGGPHGNPWGGNPWEQHEKADSNRQATTKTPS